MLVSVIVCGYAFLRSCKISAIQGRDCLVQKFRNSSVMLEHPSFRPKVIFNEIDASIQELKYSRYFILARAH